MEFLLFTLYILFALRIVYKRQGRHGLAIPVTVCSISGSYLFVGNELLVFSVILGTIVLSLLMRLIQHEEPRLQM